MNKELIYSLNDLPMVAQNIKKELESASILTLTGSLGAGKTTLVKAMLASLGINSDDVTSPTFTYVNIYKLPCGKRVYHFDLYRIESQNHFIEMGFDEYLNDADSFILIEWPGVIEDLLSNYIDLKLDYIDDSKRVLNYKIINIDKNK